MAVRIAAHYRKGRPGSNVLGLLALAVAIVASAFIFRQRPAPAPRSAETLVAQYDTISVPVPIDMVPIGTRVKEIRVKNISFPRHQIPENALTSFDGYLEAVTTAPLPADLPLFKTNLSHTALANNPVIDGIPQGMRAMTIKVDAMSAVEGWAGSGAVVDVLMVAQGATRVVAERVRILSAERSVSPVEGHSAPSVPNTVTLLVTQEQCLAINTAIPLGRIAFALRSRNDEETWQGTTYSADRLKQGSGTQSKGTTTTAGYVRFGDPARPGGYALIDGKWIKSESVPEGFLVDRSDK